MPQVVGVRFKRAGKIYYFDPDTYELPVGTNVIVETARGIEFGYVSISARDVAATDVVQPLKKVIRPATDCDREQVEENRQKVEEASATADAKIEALGLDMHLVDVEYTFDGSKVIFYFTAEGRIDFRQLVKELAGVFRTRIEMRQIGVRDEAKMIGGIGPCGLPLCCTTFLTEFAPVSIRMAKDQNLSLNPTKISGLCGRLMCCLRYEQETYEAAKKDPTLAPGWTPPPQMKEMHDDIPDFSMHEQPAEVRQAKGVAYLQGEQKRRRGKDEKPAAPAAPAASPEQGQAAPAKRKRRRRRRSNGEGKAAAAQEAAPAKPVESQPEGQSAPGAEAAGRGPAGVAGKPRSRRSRRRRSRRGGTSAGPAQDGGAPSGNDQN